MFSLGASCLPGNRMALWVAAGVGSNAQEHCETIREQRVCVKITQIFQPA